MARIRTHRSGSAPRDEGTRDAARRARPWRRGAALVLAALLAGALAAPAAADDYDPDEAGHPLRLVAYAVHPVGVALDWLIMRPAHWVVHHEPLRTLFGHEEEY